VGELFRVRSGLLLADFVEKRFDKHQLVIVPAKEAGLQRDGTIERLMRQSEEGEKDDDD
jgi:hypothetical protein